MCNVQDGALCTDDERLKQLEIVLAESTRSREPVLGTTIELESIFDSADKN